jgi:hypothetical protein
MNTKNKKIIGVVAICLVVAGLSFRGGMMYAAKNIKAAADSRQGAFSQNGFNGQSGGRMMRGGVNGGLVNGEILSKDDKSITIKLRDGGSKIVFFTPSVKVEKTVDGTATDVVVGKQVMIVGVANTDGSINATSIQMRPAQVLDAPAKQ